MTNTWESVSDMQVRRSDASAVSFEGKIYVFGGFDGQTVHSTVEIFDPTTNTWTISSIPMTVPRSGLEAIVVKDRIFVLGGRDNSANRFRSVEVWHPTKPWWVMLMELFCILRQMNNSHHFNFQALSRVSWYEHWKIQFYRSSHRTKTVGHGWLQRWKRDHQRYRSL